MSTARQIRLSKHLQSYKDSPMYKEAQLRAKGQLFISGKEERIYASLAGPQGEEFSRPAPVVEQVDPEEKKQLLKQARRIEEISYHILAGKTLKEIGALFGVSRERIRQIVEANLHDLWHETKLARLEKRTLVEKVCAKPGCGNKFMGPREGGRKYCAKTCRRKYATPEEAHEAMRAKARWRYQNDPVRREKMKRAIKRYHDRIKHDPAWKERQRIYQREYHRKMSKDPVWAAREREKARIRYHKIMADPVKREKYNKYQREYNIRRKQKEIKLESDQMVNELFGAARNKGLL